MAVIKAELTAWIQVILLDMEKALTPGHAETGGDLL